MASYTSLEQSKKLAEIVYTCDICPHKGNLMCCHNCPNFKKSLAMKSYTSLEQSKKRMDKTKELYLCILQHDDGTFKMVVGCFNDKADAERYVDGSPRIVILQTNIYKKLKL